MSDKYFTNKNILITGINGFVGTHLAKKLKSLGAKVYGISKSETGKKNVLKASILDYSLIEDFAKKKKIKICFHLAAESLVESGQKNPYYVFKINTEGTLNMLECARILKFEKIIIASTSHVYGKNKLPYFEKYTPRPSRPYETSKACTDLIAQSYAETFGLPVLIPRFVNIYGPGDLNFTRVIPKTIKTIMSGRSPRMWGGEVVRDYLYIDDAIDAYIKLAKVNMRKIEKNRIFNFGTGTTESVRELLEKIVALYGKDVTIERIKEKREQEISAQFVSWKKAQRILAWNPKVELDKGLKRTIEWYKRNLN